MRRLIPALVLVASCATTTRFDNNAWVTAEEGARLGRLVAHATSTMRSDSATSRDEFEQSLEINPGDDQLTYLCAATNASTGRADRAIALVRELANMRSDLTPRLETFEAVEGNPAFGSAVREWTDRGRVVTEGSVAFELDDREFVPEGIAWDPVDRSFYVGSTLKGAIVKIDAMTSRIETFKASRADGLYSILGLRIDATRRVLWVASAAIPPLLGLKEEDKGRTGIFAFDLRDGRLLRHADVPRDGNEHNVNDLIVTKDGTVFATDSSSGAIYRWKNDSESIEEFLPAGTFVGPNGIALAADESSFYVGSWDEGISIVEIRSGKHRRIEHAKGLSLMGPDGLYLAGDSLIAIQNSIGKGRVVRFRLDATASRITSAETLSARDSRVDEPTTGAVTDGAFYFIANSGIGLASEPGTLKDVEAARVIRIKL